MNAQQRLAHARTRLILERPFLGALVIHLPALASERCRSIATDARAIYYSPAFIESLDVSQTQFMLAHAALHGALGHFHRRGSRLAARWDRACDYAVNQLLVDDGMRAPHRTHVEARYRGLSAEAIYPLLSDAPDDDDGLDEHWFGESARGARRVAVVAPNEHDNHSDTEHLDAHQDGLDDLNSRAGTASSSHALDVDWQQRLAASAHAAANAGQLSSHWRLVLSELTQPTLPWPALLARFMVSQAREGFSFARPSRRGESSNGAGSAMLPGRASDAIEVVVALDTSGSIDPRDLTQFGTEVDALKGQIRAAVTLLACDAVIAPEAPWRFEAWEALVPPVGLAGGGSTRFTPVFDWVARSQLRPDALIYFTDAQGEFPACQPDYPVLWLVRGNAPVPWGERVQLN